MSIEGRLRDLSLIEVLQLLALGRKTGTLHCHAPLQGRYGRLVFDQGAILDAAVTASPDVASGPCPNRRAGDTKAVEDAVLDVLLWRDGTFRFAAGEPTAPTTGVRLAVDPILMEGALRAEGWRRIEARVPHARVIPTFVDIEPQQLPLLRLTPPQWEILTRVDGQRDLMALAEAMQRELTEVAELVHDLIGAGLLTLREAQAPPRRNPTPPAGPAFVPQTEPSTGPVVMVTPAPADDEDDAEDDVHEDSLFDPIAVGAAVAPAPVEPSLPREQDGAEAPALHGPTLCRHGDALARRGDFLGALAYWNAALRAPVPAADAERIREGAALAARLHALLHP
ncbi:MAG: DUF4388 domain-containing protein [Gemmatimonas sp.]|uniref:DUF4388 domain-containing protein n=1 Tax=Gemmatimonas sp. TaxID=1962908 RepID=UPI00391F700C